MDLFIYVCFYILCSLLKIFYCARQLNLQDHMRSCKQKIHLARLQLMMLQSNRRQQWQLLKTLAQMLLCGGSFH